jgi:hypothetical protein
MHQSVQRIALAPATLQHAANLTCGTDWGPWGAGLGH